MNLEWTEDELGSLLFSKGKDSLLGAVEADGDSPGFIALDYTKYDGSVRWGCKKLGPFDTQEDAEQALEKSVKEGNQ